MSTSPVSPHLAQWKFFATEEQHRSARNQMPNLRLANTARRYLAGVVDTLGNRHGLVGQQALAELSVGDLHQLALSQLGVLGVRASSSAIVLVTSGYAADAAVHLRRITECTLRGRAILSDASGEHARQWLSGRARPSAEKLAQKFGEAEDLQLLSIVAHADARGMAFLHAPDLSIDGTPTVPLLPHRDERWERSALYGVAYECGMLAACLAEAFDTAVQLPGWLAAAIKEAGDKQRSQT